MPVHISAIELENFQSIEQRTRIEFKPITLLFGPNSAGKSAVFDAMELLRVLLDPIEFDEQLAVNLVSRWARHKGKSKVRETFLAIEFPFYFKDPHDIWFDDSNWRANLHRSEGPAFHLEDYGPPGATVRIELHLKVISQHFSSECRLSECSLSIQDRPILRLTKGHPKSPDPEELEFRNGDQDDWGRWLTIYDDLGIVNSELMPGAGQETKAEKRDLTWDGYGSLHGKVGTLSLQPLKLIAEAFFGGKNTLNLFCRNAADLMFYFGTMLWLPMRRQPGVVMSDRRAPKPSEALALVDFGLKGWWSRDSFSPSSPASLLISEASIPDEHFQGLAEVAYAELLLRTANADFWGGEHAAKHLEPVRGRAEILHRVNHHLDKSLFKEKLYKLRCAATLMVPIDLDEDDPWSYYALAQPAAVRLFLQDGTGQKVELQDVGSGIPFVLPILYAASCQGFVKVQQPELHLHPALQSSIADVFVEELNRKGSGQFLIETHSEHLLLRLLRRIRDQEQGKCLTAEERLTNKEIAVYYFDPQVGGGTMVTPQLVTPLGDFYTDWPRGFFDERSRDLFDE